MLEQEKQAIALLIKTWQDSFSTGNIKKIMSLYANNAGMWGTFSRERQSSHEAIQEYFETAFSSDGHKVFVENLSVRVHGSLAICAGLYTFSWKDGGQQRAFPARFSMTLARHEDQWQIIEHHSSAMPGN